MINPIKIGSRRSKLALIQSNLIKREIEKLWGHACEIVTFQTKGDQILDRSLPQIGGKGLFTKELEDKLLDGSIDIAVHSLKDLPTELPEGLELGAVWKRQDPREALISRRASSIAGIPWGGIVATGSLRRRAQILRIRPDLKIRDLRGNVPTRIRKMKENNYDGIILALAGIKRLGLEKEAAYIFDIEEMIPAAGQGALGIEIRSDNRKLDPILEALRCKKTFLETKAERRILATLNGSCEVPIGVNATIDNSTVVLRAMVSDLEGKRFLMERLQGNVESIDALADELADKLIFQGASDIIKGLRKS